MASTRRPRDRGVRRRGRGARALPSLEPPRRLEGVYNRFFQQYVDIIKQLTDEVIERLPAIVAEGDRELDRQPGRRGDAAEAWDVDPYLDPDTWEPYYAEVLPELAMGPEVSLSEAEDAPDEGVTARLDAARKLRTVTEVIDGIQVQYARALFNTELDAERFMTDLDEELIEVNRKQFRANMVAQAERSQTLSAAAVKFAVDESPGIPAGLRKRFVNRGLSLINVTGSPRVPPIPKQHFKALEKTIQQGIRNGTRIEAMRDRLEQLKGITTRRAETIARDQVGKYHGNMMQTRQRQLGITGYIWRTVGDERVRESHEQREGERFTWNNPPSDGHPGQPINCRCSAEPDLEGALSKLEAA